MQRKRKVGPSTAASRPERLRHNLTGERRPQTNSIICLYKIVIFYVITVLFITTLTVHAGVVRADYERVLLDKRFKLQSPIRLSSVEIARDVVAALGYNTVDTSAFTNKIILIYQPPDPNYFVRELNPV